MWRQQNISCSSTYLPLLLSENRPSTLLFTSMCKITSVIKVVSGNGTLSVHRPGLACVTVAPLPSSWFVFFPIWRSAASSFCCCIVKRTALGGSGQNDGSSDFSFQTGREGSSQQAGSHRHRSVMWQEERRLISEEDSACSLLEFWLEQSDATGWREMICGRSRGWKGLEWRLLV